MEIKVILPRNNNHYVKRRVLYSGAETFPVPVNQPDLVIEVNPDDEVSLTLVDYGGGGEVINQIDGSNLNLEQINVVIPEANSDDFDSEPTE